MSVKRRTMATQLRPLLAGAGVAGALDVERRAQQAGPEVLAEEPDLLPGLVGDVVAGVEVEPGPGLEPEHRPGLRLVGVEGDLLLEGHPLLLRHPHQGAEAAVGVRGVQRVAVGGHRELLLHVERGHVHLGGHGVSLASDIRWQPGAVRGTLGACPSPRSTSTAPPTTSASSRPTTSSGSTSPPPCRRPTSWSASRPTTGSPPTWPDSDPGSYAGIYGVRPMQLALPVGDGAALVPMAGLTWVGVHPDHRRRGVLTAMLRHHVEQTHREGVALSGLHASEGAIYGRHGWGVSTQTFSLSLGRGTKLTSPGLDEEAKRLTTRFASVTDDGIAERLVACETEVAAQTPRDGRGCAVLLREHRPPPTAAPGAPRQGADALPLRPARRRGRRASPPSAGSTSGSRATRREARGLRPRSATPRPGSRCSAGWSTST